MNSYYKAIFNCYLQESFSEDKQAGMIPDKKLKTLKKKKIK